MYTVKKSYRCEFCIFHTLVFIGDYLNTHSMLNLYVCYVFYIKRGLFHFTHLIIEHCWLHTVVINLDTPKVYLNCFHKLSKFFYLISNPFNFFTRTAIAIKNMWRVEANTSPLSDYPLK